MRSQLLSRKLYIIRWFKRIIWSLRNRLQINPHQSRQLSGPRTSEFLPHPCSYGISLLLCPSFLHLFPCVPAPMASFSPCILLQHHFPASHPSPTRRAKKDWTGGIEPFASGIHQSEMLLRKLEEGQIWTRSSDFWKDINLYYRQKPSHSYPQELICLSPERLLGGGFRFPCKPIHSESQKMLLSSHTS